MVQEDLGVGQCSWLKQNQPPFQEKEYEVEPDFPHGFLHILFDVAVFAGVAMQFDREDKTQKECRLLKSNLFPIQHTYMSFCPQIYCP